MFTGLIQDVGHIERIVSGGMTELWIRTRLAGEELSLGESIAVDGTCLTVAERSARSFRAQTSPETLRRSTLGSLRPGDAVNLERAMKLGDRLGGHWVTGHVDAVAEVLDRDDEGGSWLMRFSLPRGLRPFFIEKGSVAVDGISLTVNQVGAEDFQVAIIPETQRRTALGHKRPGSRVNLEADLIGKYVARLYSLRQTPDAGVSEQSLQAAFGSRSE